MRFRGVVVAALALASMLGIGLRVMRPRGAPSQARTVVVLRRNQQPPPLFLVPDPGDRGTHALEPGVVKSSETVMRRTPSITNGILVNGRECQST